MTDDILSRSYQVKTPENSTRSSYWMYNYADIRVVKGDFLRCRTLMLSYRFDPDKVRRFGMSNLGVSLNVTNPFTFASKKFDGQDPEIEVTGTTALPITQLYTFSINIGF
ncbi:MAG: hypothetical protein LUD68_10075 [Rikenellaceae bacterium]|nr:hypothetical protein [Rikenellaceae bacterium]